jgi:hypothetical protein
VVLKRRGLTLLVLLLLRCVTAGSRAVPLSALFAAPSAYDGKAVTLRAYVVEGGPHGTFLCDDPNRPSFVMQLRVWRERDSIPELRRMTVMMAEDEVRDVARGVLSELHGVFQVLPDRTFALVLEDVRDVRWGDGVEP